MFYLLSIILLLFHPTTLSAETKSIIGWIEPVKIITEDFYIQAKIDTGADNSSLHAADITEFIRESRPWVRFNIKDQSGKVHQMEQPVQRFAKIKRHENVPQKRPVIHLGICLGKHSQMIEVNLTDRKAYKYKLLIGRSFLKGTFLIDVQAKNLTSPQCH